MSKIFSVSSQSAALALAAKAHAYLQANCVGYSAQRWDVPIQHPVSGRWSIAYEDRVFGAYAPAELALLVDYTDDWRPIPPE